MNDESGIRRTPFCHGILKRVLYCAVATAIGIAASASAQEITATPAERQAIEAQVSFFRIESDALRAAGGFAREANAEDCVLQATIDNVTYACPAPSDSRDRLKAALAARGWIPTTIPKRDPWYALDAFSKDATLAFFVCAPGRKSCLLELRQQN